MVNIPGPLGTILLIIKIIFILVSIALFYGFVYAFYKGWHFHPKFQVDWERDRKAYTLRNAMIKERWALIVKKFSLGTPDSIRLAVIEGDALIDTALKAMEIPGEHLADRLSALDAEELKSINNVWAAHRMRNDLVHTPGFTIAPDDARGALSAYETFLKEIGAL